MCGDVRGERVAQPSRGGSETPAAVTALAAVMAPARSFSAPRSTFRSIAFRALLHHVALCAAVAQRAAGARCSISSCDGTARDP